MKTSVRLFIAFLISIASLGNLIAETTITAKSIIQEVTVFLQGAQVVRYSDVAINAGTSKILLKGMSAFLDPNSIQVTGIGNFTVLSVTPKSDYFGVDKEDAEVTQLRNLLEDLMKKKEDIQTELKILADQEAYLNTNKYVKGDNNNLVAMDFEQITSFFYKQMAAIARKRLEYNRTLTELHKEIRKYQNQLNATQGKGMESSTDIYVEVKAEAALKAKLKLSYYVYTAGWTPSYDIRVNDITKPFQLVYKASVFQNSGEDWSNVKLTFSNGNPNESGNLPELTPYYLRLGSTYGQSNYRNNNAATTALDYLGMEQRQIRGKITDNNGDPVPYATVNVSGTSLGTYSDENGNFTINLSGNQSTVTFTALGYQTNSINITSEYVQVQLNENQNYLAEVEVMKSSNTFRNNATHYHADGVALMTPYRANVIKSSRIGGKKQNSNSDILDSYGYDKKSAEMTTVENQTTIEFIVDETYSVVSNAKPLTIDMKTMEITANYEYRTVPKLEASAYLIAQVYDWSQYQLLEGMANIYFENTFVGRSALDVQYLSDTLDISLGKDKNVIVKRTKLKEYSGKQFLGSDQVARRQFQIEVRNNKTAAIDIVVYDQVPVSLTKEITVEIKEISNAKLSDKTGELEWRQKLEPKGTKTLMFKYNVKFPGNQIINLE